MKKTKIHTYATINSENKKYRDHFWKTGMLPRETNLKIYNTINIKDGRWWTGNNPDKRHKYHIGRLPRAVRIMGRSAREHGSFMGTYIDVPKRYYDPETLSYYYNYSRMKCDECGGFLRHDVRGDIVCEDCGLVAQEKIMTLDARCMDRSEVYKFKKSSEVKRKKKTGGRNGKRV